VSPSRFMHSLHEYSCRYTVTRNRTLLSQLSEAKPGCGRSGSVLVHSVRYSRLHQSSTSCFALSLA
jgi:hypothetical protein